MNVCTFPLGLKIDSGKLINRIWRFTRNQKTIERKMLLSCPLCCKPHFEGVDSLRTTLVNVAIAPLTCPVCQESLKGLDKLTIHLFGHVNTNQVASEGGNDEGVGGEKCEGTQCVDSVKAEIDKSIDRICCSRTVQEPITKPQSDSPLSQTTEQPNEEIIITCDICSFTFTDKNILEMHQKLLHQTSPDEKTGKYSYHCHLCSKRFRMRGSLMVHLRVAHYGFNNHIDLAPHLLKNKEKKLATNLEKDTMEIDATDKSTTKPAQDFKQWTCDVCAKMFTTKYFLKKHKRLHTGEMPYSCTICSKSFTFQQSYHKHMLYHSSEKPYVCAECGRAFKEHSTLQNHARIHSGERPFGCEICGKRFRQRVSYLVHMRIHTGVMPYKCTACDKSFRYKVSQRSHKCPANPPGSVIRIGDPDTSSIPATPSTPSASATQTNQCNNESMTQLIMPSDDSSRLQTGTKCIMSVDYDTGNINIIPVKNKLNNMSNQAELLQKGQAIICSNTLAEDGLLSTNDGIIHHQSDLYTMVMSPSLPQVESLCLNNNSPISHPTSPIEENNIQIIREKCLEELFK